MRRTAALTAPSDQPEVDGVTPTIHTAESLIPIDLVVHDFKPDNGQGRYLIELVHRLSDRCRFRVLANTFPEVAVPGAEMIPIPANRRRYLFTIPTFLFAVERELRRGPGQRALVHAQGFSCWGADMATVHICNAARWRTLPPAERHGRRFARIISPVERAFYSQRRLRHLITMSHRLQQEVASHYGWRRPVTVIPHGTDGALFRPPESDEERRTLRRHLGVPDHAWLWLFMGEAVKGLDVTLAALPEFPEARLVVISRSDSERYRRRAEELGVADRLIFKGFDAQPERVHRVADVFAYPTQYESFGMVVAEAMASGVPVVVGREAGVAELIEDGVNGLLVSPDDVGAMVSRMRILASDRERGREMGRAARKTILRHSWDACAEATYAVYHQVWGEIARARSASASKTVR